MVPVNFPKKSLSDSFIGVYTDLKSIPLSPYIILCCKRDEQYLILIPDTTFMLSKSQIQVIKSLKLKKFREEHQLFIAEGRKLVNELITSTIKVRQIYATSDFFRTTKIDASIERFEIKESELERISSLTSPNEVLAVCEIPTCQLNMDSLKDKLTLVLEDIKDPGNLGTIIRIADWFGIETIICSEQTAELYNPKVIQATMGSVSRVQVHYMELPVFFNHQSENAGNDNPQKIYGALLEGDNIYTQPLSANGFIVIGNESKGISETLLPCITHKINIPSFSHFNPSGGEAESLNAAVATSIICSEFRRRKF